jgi:leucyl aminopeptidase (aminopeptidase T)
MAGVRLGEEVLITVDARTPLEFAEAFMNAAYAVGARPSVVTIPMPPLSGKGAYPITNPSPSVSAAVENADILFDFAICYAPCVVKLLRSGKRCCVLGFGEHLDEILVRTVGSVDLQRLKEEAQSLAQMWSKASTAEITSESGSELHIDIRDVYGIAWDGFVLPQSTERWVPLPPSVPGIVDYVPAEGKIIADGFLEFNADWHIPEQTVTIYVKDGKVNKIEGGLDAKNLEKYLRSFNDPSVYLGPVHVNIGTNPNAKLTPTQELERYRGSLSIAFGDNSFLSQLLPRPKTREPVRSSTHWDVQILKPTLYLDEELVIENGEIQL